MAAFQPVDTIRVETTITLVKVLKHTRTHCTLAVIGGGPAGLRAAEVASANGIRVHLFDAKPSVGRKFLVAGKGGLNLTNAESPELFQKRYTGNQQPDHIWQALLADFDAAALRSWANALGVETFVASSGRVYPKDLTAAPLLRSWLARLKERGVVFSMNHKLSSLSIGNPLQLGFENGTFHTAEAVILALGGGSWKKTGSDGQWIQILEKAGISIHPLEAANCGWEHSWEPETLALAEGKPLKNIHVFAGDRSAHGELLITRYGLEGGPVYQLGATLRKMPQPALTIDLKPAFTHDQLLKKMESVRRNFLQEARIRWKLGDAAYALLARKEWTDRESLAGEAKQCVLPLIRPRPIDEAISSAGGICWSELDDSLMVKKIPGLFAAGEMIDWEAPTGGYLMQGCFATATRAAHAASDWIRRGVEGDV